MVAEGKEERGSLVIGTRGSRLALWQAEWVQTQLQVLLPDREISLKRIRTSGDKILDVPLANIGGKGLFVKEIEEALLREEIDVAVHSMKDVPTVLPKGLSILAIPAREDPHDALVSHHGQTLSKLPDGARIGTSSLRRQAQLLYHRPDLKISMLRGNLDTRLRKVEDGEFDAIILAAAGLRRMGWEDRITEIIPQAVSVPAIGQGAIGIEGRQADTFVQGVLDRLNDPPSHTAVLAERALLERLEGGCQVPIGAHATLSKGILSLDGVIASVDGSRLIRDQIQGDAGEAESLGVTLAERLLARGGREVLDQIYGKGLV